MCHDEALFAPVSRVCRPPSAGDTRGTLPRGDKMHQPKRLKTMCFHIPDKKLSQSKGRSSISANLSNMVGAAKLFSLVAIMLALSYAAVPLYQIYCQTSGFGGTVQKTTSVPVLAPMESKLSAAGVDDSRATGSPPKDTVSGGLPATRALTINFNADINENLP